MPIKRKSIYINSKKRSNYNECWYENTKNNLIAYLRQSKKKYFSAFINMYSKNINEIRKMIKTIAYKNMQTISIPNLLNNADKTPTDTLQWLVLV